MISYPKSPKAMSLMEMAQASHETWIFYLGSAGLILAFLWLVFRKKKNTKEPETSHQSTTPSAHEKSTLAPQNTWWSALGKSRDKFLARLSGLNVEDLKMELEEACITSDLGVSNTSDALEKIEWKELAKLSQEERVLAAKQSLSNTFKQWLEATQKDDFSSWPLQKNPQGPTVVWFVGVNGVGKTTSIAKVASEIKNRGQKVILAAGDTFRAAAGEQLEEWARRLNIECVRGGEGADSSSVLFDALQKAQSQNIDFVLCDSAGRLHNQNQLMEALEKNKRVMNKALPGSPHEVVLVLDANTGQNMLSQAEHFLKSVGVTGLILTKLDGSARGGAIVAVSRKIALPIVRLGLGEKAEDLRPFDSKSFAAALLGLN